MGLHPLHEAINHLLLPRLVERDGELVAVDPHDVAVAEFLVKDATDIHSAACADAGWRATSATI